jgi:hypothetical protein
MLVLFPGHGSDWRVERPANSRTQKMVHQTYRSHPQTQVGKLRVCWESQNTNLSFNV